MLYADDLVLTSKTMEGLNEKFWKWKEAFESKGLKVNLGNTKVIVSGAEGEVTEIHGRCAKVKRVTLRLGKDFVCGGCKKQADGFMDSVEELCEEMETVRGFCYLGDRVNAGGGCEAAVTARARIGWVKFRECGEVLNSKRVLAEAERNGLSEMCKISDVTWE
ncbi:uncharacterized protein LOC122961149 [Acropora millepora]|uniref:uncharacterized protein LOC122961149 n=1 Tax=Acropora millepora TaxID=45264 RepID=UPI001CF2C16A|nr:uncharacterized protein LOC122961149 [Acropora millepora]